MYVAVDIKTTGPFADEHQVLAFAAVAWTNNGPIDELPYLDFLIKPSGNIVGDPYFLNKNKDLLGTGKYHISDVLYEFDKFLITYFKRPIHLVFYNSWDIRFLSNWQAFPRYMIHNNIFHLPTLFADEKGVLSFEDKSCLENARNAIRECRNFILEIEE